MPGQAGLVLPVLVEDENGRVVMVLVQAILDAAVLVPGGRDEPEQFTPDLRYYGYLRHSHPFDFPTEKAFPRSGPTP